MNLNTSVLADIAAATEFDSGLLDHAKPGQVEECISKSIRIKKTKDTVYIEFDKPIYIKERVAWEILEDNKIDVSKYVEMEDQGKFRRHIFRK